MIESPARHFLVQRMNQLSSLSRLHLPLRAGRFIEDMVRPASDMLLQVSGWHLNDEKLEKKIANQRRRLDAIHTALTAHINDIDQRPAALPKTRMARELRPGL